MNVTPKLKRVGKVAGAIFFVSLIMGCAGSQPSAVQVDGLNDQKTVNNFDNQVAADIAWDTDFAIQNTSLQAEPIRNVEIASRKLINASEKNPGLTFRQGTTSEEVIVSSASGIGEYQILQLENPSRLVVDIFGLQNETNRTFELPESTMVSSVRVGAHADKSRIVMDLKSDSLVHEVLKDGSGLVVSLGAAELATASIAPAEPVKAAVVAGHDRKVEIANNEKTNWSENQQANDLARELSNVPSLASLRIEDVGNDNMVVAQMTAGGAYTLSRTAPSEHVLRLMNAELGSASSMPVLAAPGAGQIRAVRPVKEGNDVLLRIFSAPNADLKAEARGARIVVSAKTSGRDGGASPLAQLEPEAAAGEDMLLASPQAEAEAMETDLGALLGDDQIYTGRLISLDLQDTDIDNALRIIAEVSNLNIIASSDVTGKVTLRLIDVPWDQALDVILKTNGLDKVQEGNVVRIAPVEKLRQERESLRQARRAEEELEPLQVRYIRISYAKAADLRPLVETVLTERGTVTYDDRTNQIIVKDIRSGIRNVAELVTRLDLRTPQVLLETQIVEAQRSLLRDLGAEVGFDFVRSPATGNATGYNFPNAIGGALGSNFAAAAAPASASFLFDSADGSMSLDARMTALEEEGRVRVISRPAVATTNNRPAEIRSVEKIRVRTPSGGSTVAVGQGGTAAGTGANATETIEIGITLSVTPQASPDYFVLLDVDAKSSSFGTNEVDGIPSEVERSATSTILVSSGQTFAMGGIYRITDIDSVGGVPFFKDIPFLGHLFRNARIQNSDEELLFFITPRIIEGSFDDAAMRSAS